MNSPRGSPRSSSQSAYIRRGVSSSGFARMAARKSASVIGVSLHQVAELLAEALEHTRLGHAHRAGAHAQVRGDVLGRPVLDGRLPEGLPGARLELTADRLQAAQI